MAHVTVQRPVSEELVVVVVEQTAAQAQAERYRAIEGCKSEQEAQTIA